MAILFWTMILLAVVAVAVTAYAVASAKDGVEDELGFHPLAGADGPGASVTDDTGSRRRPGLGRVPVMLGVQDGAPLTKTLWVSHG